MKMERILASLRELDSEEQVGKRYFDYFHVVLSYPQYYSITHGPVISQPVSSWNGPSVQEGIQQFRAFLEPYIAHGLTADQFISEKRKIETEKLLRYIHVGAHKHDFIEVVCILEGSCVHYMDGHESKHTAGDFTIIPPGVVHELYPNIDCVCLTTKFRTEVFKELFSDVIFSSNVLSAYLTQTLNLPYYRCALTLHTGSDQFFRDIVLRIYDQQIGDRCCGDIVIQSAWVMLLAYLVQNYQDTCEILVNDSVQHSQMIDILNYVFANFQTITLSETARHFAFNSSYLSIKIKKLTGKSFSDLIRDYKLLKAEELLTQTDMKLDRICDEVGYKDMPQFIRSFKSAYGATPGNYRKQHQE